MGFVCVQTRTSTTPRKGVIRFVLKQIELLCKASEILEELKGTQCNVSYCSSAKHLSSLFCTFGHSYIVQFFYKQGFVAKHFVGAMEREGGRAPRRRWRETKPHSSIAQSLAIM